MPILCFGPVCVPLNLLLPFLLGLAHQYGWLKWIKREWVTFRFWIKRFNKWRGVEPVPAAKPGAQPGVPAGAAEAGGGGGGGGADGSAGFTEPGAAGGVAMPPVTRQEDGVGAASPSSLGVRTRSKAVKASE